MINIIYGHLSNKLREKLNRIEIVYNPLELNINSSRYKELYENKSKSIWERGAYICLIEELGLDYDLELASLVTPLTEIEKSKRYYLELYWLIVLNRKEREIGIINPEVGISIELIPLLSRLIVGRLCGGIRADITLFSNNLYLIEEIVKEVKAKERKEVTLELYKSTYKDTILHKNKEDLIDIEEDTRPKF